MGYNSIEMDSDSMALEQTGNYVLILSFPSSLIVGIVVQGLIQVDSSIYLQGLHPQVLFYTWPFSHIWLDYR